jgi:hypothetical protein
MATWLAGLKSQRLLACGNGAFHGLQRSVMNSLEARDWPERNIRLTRERPSEYEQRGIEIPP